MNLISDGFGFFPIENSRFPTAILPSLTYQSLDNKGIPKSFHYAGGLVEGSETIIFMILCLLFPNLFVYFSFIFIVLCLITIVFRIIVCYRELNDN